MLERTFHRRPCRATDVSEGLRLTSRAAAPRHLSGCSRQEHKTNTTVFATKIIGSTSEERQSEERFLDVQQILSKFNPLTENHLLVWEDSDDEDGAVQAELPITNSWEDSSEYRGLEHQPVRIMGTHHTRPPSTRLLSPASWWPGLDITPIHHYLHTQRVRNSPYHTD